METTILNDGLTFVGGMKPQAFQNLVRAVKVASVAVVTGALALTGNVSAGPVATVITLNNGVTDLTSAASYSIISNIPGSAVASVAPGVTPSATTSILFYNNGLLPGGTTVDLYSIPNFSPTPFFPTVNPGGLTLTANTSMSVDSINDANAGWIYITNTSGISDTLTITGLADNTDPTPLATDVSPIGTGAGSSSDLIYVANGAHLGFGAIIGGTLTLALTPSGNIDNNGTLHITDAVTTNLVTGQTLTFTGTGVTTVSGGISGLDAIEVNNAGGSVIFSGANTYTGNTLLDAGILNIQSAGALGTPPTSTALITVSSGAALQIQGGITTVGTGTLTLNGTGVGGNGALENVSGDNTYTGLIELNSPSTIGSDSGTLTLSGGILNGANTLTLTGAGDGVISNSLGNGAGGLTMTGTGNWTLSGTNSYTGPTTVNAGTLQVGDGTSGSLAPTSALTMGGGTFVLFGNATGLTSQTVNGLHVNLGASEVVVNANTGTGTVLNLGAITAATGGTVDFVLPTGTQSATNGITTSRFNILGILGGFATVNGISWATKAGSNIIALADGSYTTTTSAGNTAGSYAVRNIDVTSNQAPTGLIAPNSLRFNDTGLAANSSETLTLTGPINVITSGGILMTTGVGTGTSTITGSSITSAALTRDLYVTQNDTAGILTILSRIVNSLVPLTLVASGDGQLNLFGANTYTGGTQLNGSTIEIGTGVAANAGGAITPFGSGAVHVNAVTTLTTDGLNTAGGAIAYALANGFVLNSALTVNVPGTGAGLTLNGVISGAGTLIVNDGTTGTLTLTNGSNSYSGGTIVDGGTLTATNFPTTLGSTSGSLQVNGSTGGTVLNLTTTGTTTLGSLSGSTANGAATINTGGSNFQVLQTTAGTYQGAINGASSLEVSGTAPLSLTGASNYSGGTTIDMGAVLAAGNVSALGSGNVLNNGLLETTATSLAGAPQTINAGTAIVSSAYTQTTGTTGNPTVLLLQVVSNQGVQVQTQAAAGLGGSYDTLAASGSATFNYAPTNTIVLNFQGAAPALAGQRFQVVSVPGPLNTSLVTSTGGGVFNPTAVTTTGNINPAMIPITSYNDSFNGTFANNNIIVTLFQPFNTFTGLTPNQNSVANNLDGLANALFNPASPYTVTTANGVIYTPLSGVNKDFFDNILEGVSLAAGAGNVGHALDELSPQRYEILHNVAFDNYAFDIQSLDQEFARERMGFGGVDTAGFTFNNSQLGPELSQIRSRLLAWSPAQEPGLLSDSSQAVLGGVKMIDKRDKKDMKEIKPETPEQQFSVFIDGGVDLGDKDGNEDLSHSSYTTGRVRIGADYRICKDVRVGLLFGYNHTDADLDNEGSKAHVDGYTPGVFVTYADKDGFYANGLFTYTANEYSTARNIIIPGVNRTANGSSSGDQYGGDLDGGYDFHRGDWTFGPSLGLTYVNLGIDSFTETGAGAANLAVGNQSAESLRSRLGGTLSYRTEIGSVVLTPYLSAYWQHEFLDNGANITSSFVGLPGGDFTVQTTSGDSDNALLGVGLNAELNETVTLFLSYGAEAGGSSFFGQSATGGVKLGF